MGLATPATAAGSTPLADSRSPSTSIRADRIRTTSATPGTRDISSAIVDEKPCPTTLETTKSATTSWASALSMLAFAEAPSTDIIVTRETPIIRADAVAPVRRGLRREFCSAMSPTAPNPRR